MVSNVARDERGVDKSKEGDFSKIPRRKMSLFTFIVKVDLFPVIDAARYKPEDRLFS